MFHCPLETPRTAHLPLESVVVSGPPWPPLRSMTLAPAIGLPVALSVTTPERRLLPRQSSPANSVAARQRTAAASANVFFKMILLGLRGVRKKSRGGEFPRGRGK